VRTFFVIQVSLFAKLQQNRLWRNTHVQSFRHFVSEFNRKGLLGQIFDVVVAIVLAAVFHTALSGAVLSHL